MRTDFANLRDFLSRELLLRKTSRSSYSKRAFARDLGINATTLTEFLAKKRELSAKKHRSYFLLFKKEALLFLVRQKPQANKVSNCWSETAIYL